MRHSRMGCLIFNFIFNFIFSFIFRFINSFIPGRNLFGPHSLPLP